jgi:outer membrane murein-binding lipoprotein Lpp
MFRGRILQVVVLSVILISGCSKLPGLRVLTGQDAQGNNLATTDQTVQVLNLVMADKTGATDPSLLAAADRIEAADSQINIIEVRKNDASRVFTVNILMDLSGVDFSTDAGKIDFLERTRRAFELIWQGTLQASEGTDQIDIKLLGPAQLATLDHGASFVGILVAEGQIDRTEAARYLSGARNLSNFYDLIVSGTLDYQMPSKQILYDGTPNHPMFMIPAASASGQ